MPNPPVTRHISHSHYRPRAAPQHNTLAAVDIRHSADSTSAVAAADTPAAEASGTRMGLGLGRIVAEGEKHRSSLVQRPVEESGGRRGRGPGLGRKEVGRPGVRRMLVSGLGFGYCIRQRRRTGLL
jgi:hypothetical protein